GLDLGPAPGACLALVAMHLQWHRGLVGDRVADHALVVLEGAAQDRVHRLVQPLDVLVLEVASLAEWGQLRGPQDLVYPRAADPGDRALVAKQRMEVAGLVEQLRELLDGRRR